MHDVTIVIPTFNRPEKLKRAVQSAVEQTHKCEIIIMDDGGEPPCNPDESHLNVKYCYRGRADHGGLSWYEGVYMAQGKYVTILLDDDWLEPTFIERCLGMLADDVGYVFTEALIHHPDTEPVLNLQVQNKRETRHYPSALIYNDLMGMPLCITPACCLHRRDDMLRNFFVNGIPGSKITDTVIGPEILFTLLPLLQYPKIGFISDVLVNLDAHPGSITTAAVQGDELDLLKCRYHFAKNFFLAIRNSLTVRDLWR